MTWWANIRGLRWLGRRYARRYHCPMWGHQPFGQYGWAPKYIGKFDKQAGVQGVCENCGGVIPVAEVG